MKHLLTATLIISLVHAACSTTRAQTVEVPDTLPSVEEGGPGASDLASSAPIGTDLAMLYHVPAAGDADFTPATQAASPLTLKSATGAETRIGVDLAAANAASQGWPWYGKAALVAGCVVVAGLTAWAVIEASNSGSHDGDSSSHLTVVNNGQDGSVNVTYSNSGGGNSSWRQGQ